MANLRKSIQGQLILHEGLKLGVYKCPANKWTIGVGRNLEAVGLRPDEMKKILGQTDLSKTEVIEELKWRGITKDEALFLLENDIYHCRKDLERAFLWFEDLDRVRQKVLIDMRLNLGLEGLKGFRKMIAHLEVGAYANAADEMKDSLWYRQVKTRGERLVAMMATGLDYER